MNIYFWGFVSGTFIRIYWPWNRPCFIYCVFCVRSLSRRWFILWFKCVSFIVLKCIYCCIGRLWFLYFAECVNLFCAEIGGVMASFTTFLFDFPSLSTILLFPSLRTVSVVVNNTCLVSFKYTILSNLFTWCIRFLRQRANGIWCCDLIAWSSPPF